MSDGAHNLTGVWHGQYLYPVPVEPVHFLATVIDSGGHLTGMTQETAGLGGQPVDKAATLSGTKDGTSVSFLKTYTPASEAFQDVVYVGTLNAEGDEIEGAWIVPDPDGEETWAGTFLMIRKRTPARAETRETEATL